MNESLAKNYAEALFSLSLDNDNYLEIQKEMKTLKQVLNENEEFVSLLCSSFLSLKEKEEIIDKVLADFSEDVKSLLKVICKNQRASITLNVIEEYNSSSLNEKKIQTSDFVQSLYNSLLSMKNSLYAHCHLESWEFEIQFFSSYEELEKDFFGRYEGEFIPWNEMNDKEFESYIKDFEEPGLALLTPHRR